ncbi:MAG TPA: BamA/TamA family outer membrane protein [Gammaproteobacteria bacterium]|nr:BamA/TamA family outer membrane protein [Gammaproteobacteria bacterium]
MRSYYLILLVLLSILVPGVGEGQSESARVYVRRIEFQGTEGIADEVLRRELLLLEGTFLNTVALEQSRLQLERLPYVESAQVFLQPVDGALNQVDVRMVITQAPARTYGGGGGYSESQRVSVHGFFTHENIFGTGQRFSASANVSEFRTLAELSYTNPFLGSARVSRTLSLGSRQVDRLTADTTEVEADLASVRLEFGYRTGEHQAIALGLTLNDVDLATGSRVSDQWLDWVQSNGNPTMEGSAFVTDFRSAEFLFRWRQDTRDAGVFPDRGLEQSVILRSAIPGSEVEYYAIDYELTKHWPLTGRWEARLDAKLGYGAAYGLAASSLPPYLNWFAGGPNSVRGYREGGIGPRDSLGNPYGGNRFVSGQFELMMPLPEKWRGRMRLGIFYDIGSVFSTEDVAFLDGAGGSLDYGFELSGLRQSAGISARVLMPIGLVRLSYGVPLHADDEHTNPFLRDDTEGFQIAIDVNF